VKRGDEMTTTTTTTIMRWDGGGGVGGSSTIVIAIISQINDCRYSGSGGSTRSGSSRRVGVGHEVVKATIAGGTIKTTTKEGTPLVHQDDDEDDEDGGGRGE